ncbi:amidohydrolase family protein [Microvirga alba]|uniref:Amidohydrolase family protein n=1 Tax=Microvirga alba TaxID=2791025 RepID=A0A931BWT3_9HYPH|nr:amidohydrolase family protein [Microvirga alba]MBF9235285.1 amidohydrolase family protein [Microvirga alba]
MRILDSHFHWWPRTFFEQLCARKDFPKARRNANGGYDYWRKEGSTGLLNLEPEWFDLETQFAYMDRLGHQVDVVCSIGPLSIHFSDIPAEEGRDAAMQWNEEMAGAQRKYSGRLWASAAVPLVDTGIALEVLDHAICKLGLMGVNLPGSVGNDPRIDAERLEPFYSRVAELGIPMFLHPTDAVFQDVLEGYDGALHLTMGRVMEVSVAASRLIFSGIMERHPNLKIVMSHTGGALPYQSGRMDKNGARVRLPHPPSTYMKRMFTDTVSPHSLGMKFAIEYYGIDNVMYGTDYPCWDPAAALKLLDELDLSDTDKEKLFYGNAKRILGLRAPAEACVDQARSEPAHI